MEIINNAILKMKKGIIDKEVLIALILCFWYENDNLNDKINELNTLIKSLRKRIKFLEKEKEKTKKGTL